MIEKSKIVFIEFSELSSGLGQPLTNVTTPHNNHPRPLCLLHCHIPMETGKHISIFSIYRIMRSKGHLNFPKNYHQHKQRRSHTNMTTGVKSVQTSVACTIMRCYLYPLTLPSVFWSIKGKEHRKIKASSLSNWNTLWHKVGISAKYFFPWKLLLNLQINYYVSRQLTCRDKYMIIKLKLNKSPNSANKFKVYLNYTNYKLCIANKALHKQEQNTGLTWLIKNDSMATLSFKLGGNSI